MKRRALRKDFYMEIKKSMGRFLSIFFIVALGVAFFSGIRAAEPDMRLSADAYFDEHALMDLEIISTLGLTNEDLDAIRKVEGVQKAEGSYSTDVLCNQENSQQVLHVFSGLSDMNQVQVDKGRLPEKSGECLMDISFLESSGFKIGDKIRLESGTDDAVTNTIKTDTYTIVGSGSSPAYISFGRGSSTIGTGDVSGFLLIPKSDFTLDVYTEIYLQAEGAKEKTAFTDGYEDVVKRLQKQVKAISDKRCELRKTQLVNDADEELKDAGQKLADGKKEAEDKLAEAEAAIADGETKLADGKAQVAAGRQAISDAKTTLDQKQKELNEGQKEYQSGKSQLDQGKQELEAKAAEFGQKEADVNSQFSDAEEQLSTVRNQLDIGKQEYEINVAEQKKVADSLVLAQEQLKQLQELPDEERDPQQEAVLQDTITRLTEVKAQMDAGLLEAKAKLEEGEAQYQVQKQALDTQKAAAFKGLEQGRTQLNEARKQLEENEAKLQGALTAMESGQAQIISARAEIKDKEAAINEAEQEITANEQTLTDGKNEFKENKQKAEEELKVNEDKLKDAEEQVAKIEKPKWYVETRSVLSEYDGYGENADRMRAIGQVFPVLFFLVAALISLTTMTRMVEEQRIHIGTLKALGYSKLAIAGKYLGYAFIATLGGSVLGVLVGEKILPYIIVTAYKIMYQHMPNVVVPYDITYASMATAAAVACTMIATILACYKELAAHPAVLMRPPAPKQGKRVLIEKVTFLWKHLSFTWKSTIRNLIRYKKRFLMTVFGIGGCMALMIVGFGLKDSIVEIGDLQYKELLSYQGSAYLKDGAAVEKKQEMCNGIEKDNNITDDILALTKKIEISVGKEKQDVYLMVPKDSIHMDKFIRFRSRVTKEAYSLADDGVILTEKMAKTLDVKKGDSITVKVRGTEKKIKIEAVTENYMGHYLYLSSDNYKQIYGSEADYNSILFKVKEGDSSILKTTGEKLLKYDAVQNVSYNDNMEDRVNDMLQSLNLVIVVLIMSAGMLAFVVLYNLNNININERKRELATIKVLGFYDMEVGEYVYRENILITIIGVLVGIVMGIILHRYIITTVEIENVMFGRNINLPSFIYSVLFTVGFSVFVNWMMYFKLKKIDMVESLKSVE